MKRKKDVTRSSQAATYIHTCYTCSYEAQRAHASLSLISRSGKPNKGMFKTRETHAEDETSPKPSAHCLGRKTYPPPWVPGKPPRRKKPFDTIPQMTSGRKTQWYLLAIDRAGQNGGTTLGGLSIPKQRSHSCRLLPMLRSTAIAAWVAATGLQ